MVLRLRANHLANPTTLQRANNTERPDRSKDICSIQCSARADSPIAFVVDFHPDPEQSSSLLYSRSAVAPEFCLRLLKPENHGTPK